MKYAFMMILAMFMLCGVCAAEDPTDTPPIVGKWYSQIELKELDNGKIQYRMDFKEEDNVHTVMIAISNEETMNDPIMEGDFNAMKGSGHSMTGGVNGTIKPSADEESGDHIVGRFTTHDTKTKTISSGFPTLASFSLMEFVEITYYGDTSSMPVPASMERTSEVSSMPIALDGNAFFKTDWEMPIVLNDYIAEYMVYGVVVFEDGTFGQAVQVLDEPVPVMAQYGTINVLFDTEMCNRLHPYTHVYVQMLSAYNNAYGTMLPLGQ